MFNLLKWLLDQFLRGPQNPSQLQQSDQPAQQPNLQQWITRPEVLRGHDSEAPLTSELEYNLTDLLRKLNKFRQIYGQPMKITSGYRPVEYNKQIGGSPKSAHLFCQAVDIADNSRKLTDYIIKNPSILDECDLYMEDPAATPTWVHLQSRRATVRIFRK